MFTTNKPTQIIKSSFTKSIFVHYLQDGTCALKQRLRNLNLKRVLLIDSVTTKEFGEKILSKKSTNFRIATSFRFEPANLGLSFNYEIPELNDLHTQNLIVWKERMTNLATTCNWTEQQFTIILKNSINPSLWKLINEIDSSTRIFQTLFAQIYNSSTVNTLYNKLQCTTQTDYEKNSEYKEIITRIKKR